MTRRTPALIAAVLLAAGCSDSAPTSSPKVSGSGKAPPAGLDQVEGTGTGAGSAPVSRDAGKGK